MLLVADVHGAFDALARVARSGEPLLVLATSFALVFLLDALDGARISLPGDSVVMAWARKVAWLSPAT